ELADNLLRAEHLRDVQGKLRGGNALAEAARDVDADDLGREEVNGLTEHAGLGVNAAHAPADDADTVDHRGVRVGADEGVGVVEVALMQHALGEVLKVHLMDNADARRDNAEGLKSLLAPLEELVALAVPLELHV